MTIISLLWPEVWGHKIILTPQMYYWSTCTKLEKVSRCIWVLGISIVPMFLRFLFNLWSCSGGMIWFLFYILLSTRIRKVAQTYLCYTWFLKPTAFGQMSNTILTFTLGLSFIDAVFVFSSGGESMDGFKWLLKPMVFSQKSKHYTHSVTLGLSFIDVVFVFSNWGKKAWTGITDCWNILVHQSEVKEYPSVHCRSELQWCSIRVF